MPAETTERVHLNVAEARALAERAMRGIGYEPEEARILVDHVIDAALCGYEYSGLLKLLNADLTHAVGSPGRSAGRRSCAGVDRRGRARRTTRRTYVAWPPEARISASTFFPSSRRRALPAARRRKGAVARGCPAGLLGAAMI